MTVIFGLRRSLGCTHTRTAVSLLFLFFLAGRFGLDRNVFSDYQSQDMDHKTKLHSLIKNLLALLRKQPQVLPPPIWEEAMPDGRGFSELRFPSNRYFISRWLQATSLRKEI